MIFSLPLLYRGSVKDVYGREGESPYIFAFSDRYSIFDWGAMPDELSRKGESLAVMGDLFFRALAKQGVLHHSLGLRNENLQALGAGEVSRYLAVEAVTVLRPQESHTAGKISFNYGAYVRQPVRTLVPLEVIFRFGTPQGSSLVARAEKDPGLLTDLGLARAPRFGEKFAEPIVEFSTKLEPGDRPLRYAEAQNIAGLSSQEFQNLCLLTKDLARKLEKIFATLNIELWDGKFEFAFWENKRGVRNFALVDSIGPDELRLLLNGVHLSKEFIRQVYATSAWYKALNEAKALAKAEGTKDWKAICRDRFGASPDPLPARTKALVEQIYPALANALAVSLGETAIFANTPTLSELIPQLQELTKV